MLACAHHNCSIGTLRSWDEAQCPRVQNAPQTAAEPDAADAPEQLSQGAMDMAQWLQRPAAEWSMDDQLLAHGAAIIAEKRAAVHAELGFTVSAGAHTSMWHLSDATAPRASACRSLFDLGLICNETS